MVLIIRYFFIALQTMILSDEEKQSILKEYRRTPQWVLDAREEKSTLEALVTGSDFANLLLKIEHIESDKRALARKRYSRSIQDTIERLLRLLDNVFIATGGVRSYKFKSEQSQKELLHIVTHVRDNKSLAQWLHVNWIKNLYITDPSGVMFLEYAENTPPYPTYKSINNIRHYVSNGQNLEYILFEPYVVLTPNGERVNYIRLIDDITDNTYKISGNNFLPVVDSSFIHPFGKTPGVINSERVNISTKKRLSFIGNIIPLLKELARDQSILTIYKFLNGFVTPIRPVIVCPTCKGIGKVGIDKCPSCNGEGSVLRKDVTDEIQIPISLDKEEGYSLPNGIFTYMSPPLDIWNQYNSEIAIEENKAFQSLWGTHKEKVENERTAFETFIDTQPVTIQLSVVSEVAEFIEWQFTEWIANYIDVNKSKTDSISTISYGKNFIIESPEALLEKYRINKAAGVSVVILDRQLMEIITSKYRNNPDVLYKELIKKDLDYYVHYTIKEVSDVFGSAEAQKKMLFTDFWETINWDRIQVPNIEVMKNERDVWIQKELIKLNLKTKKDE